MERRWSVGERDWWGDTIVLGKTGLCGEREKMCVVLAIGGKFLVGVL